MEGAMDCLIDLNSPVPNNQRVSLVSTNSACQKITPACPDFTIPALDDNNPFDLVVRLTEMNEAVQNDPFEIAFEQACGYQVPSSDEFNSPSDSEKCSEIISEKPAEVPAENQPLSDYVGKKLGCSDEFNLEEVQPPEFLANSSFELSDNDSININDTLHLSSMSDLKLTPGGAKCSPLIAKYCNANNVFSEEKNSSVSSKIKLTVNSGAPKKTLSPINFSLHCLTLSDKSSFEDSPSKMLCELKSEESVKTLIESRIQKCIAKALNDSHRQFRNSILLEPGESSFVANQAQPSAGNLRASLSVPQNLHLLRDNEIYRKPEQSTVATTLSPFKPNIFEDLTIPVLDNKTDSAQRSFNKSFDIVTDTKPEISSKKTDGIQHKVEMTAAQRDQKMSHYREIIDAELQKTETVAKSPEVEKESKPKGHRRSLSCDVMLPPQLSAKGSSPPKLPPLPLSSDTIRNLSLCSKYSPTKSQERSPGNTTSKVPNRPVPLPACAQPKLVLRKKASAAGSSGPLTAMGSFGGATKGPMKAIVPVRNMTRFAGSPRPPQSQNRRASIASSRQSSLDSPSYQKSKLCPLAASTPSNPTLQDKTGIVRAPPVITVPSPRRSASTGIPSPSRRNSINSQNSKPDTPTRRSPVTALGRHANPRVLVDKNGLTSPSMTPIRKSSVQTDARAQPPKSTSHTLGKENISCL